MSELSPRQSNFLFYTTKEGDVNIQVIQQDETVWLTQKSMSELFGVVKSNIDTHHQVRGRSNKPRITKIIGRTGFTRDRTIKIAQLATGTAGNHTLL